MNICEGQAWIETIGCLGWASTRKSPPVQVRGLKLSSLTCELVTEQKRNS